MELNEINLNEVFDSEIAQYKAINVNQKAKVPQLWNIKVPGNDNLLVRMVSYLSKGDAVKQVKMGDKFVQVFLMSLSKNGNASELRNGLGADPIGALNTIFDTVYEQVKKLKKHNFNLFLFFLLCYFYFKLLVLSLLDIFCSF